MSARGDLGDGSVGGTGSRPSSRRSARAASRGAQVVRTGCAQKRQTEGGRTDEAGGRIEARREDDGRRRHVLAVAEAQARAIVHDGDGLDAHEHLDFARPVQAVEGLGVDRRSPAEVVRAPAEARAGARRWGQDRLSVQGNDAESRAHERTHLQRMLGCPSMSGDDCSMPNAFWPPFSNMSRILRTIIEPRRVLCRKHLRRERGRSQRERQCV